MTLHIQLPTELEAVIRERASATGVNVETYILNVVKDDVAEDLEAPGKRRRSHEEFMARLDAMIQRHGIRNGKFDDSRESIYAGCGE